MRIQIVGHSHIASLMHAWDRAHRPEGLMELLEFQLRDDTLLDPHRIPSASGFETYDQQKVLERCNAAGALDARVLLLSGNAHSMASMLD